MNNEEEMLMRVIHIEEMLQFLCRASCGTASGTVNSQHLGEDEVARFNKLVREDYRDI